MKIKFVKGTAGVRGAMVVSFQGVMVCGYRATWLYENKDEYEDELVIVKQRSIWFTILISVHELAHWIVNKFHWGRTGHKWIDKHIMRKADKDNRKRIRRVFEEMLNRRYKWDA